MRLLLPLCWLLLLGLAAAGQAAAQTAFVLDSASIWPRHLYVVLENPPFPVHHVQASHIDGEGSVPGRNMALEIVNLLVPAALVRSLAPLPAPAARPVLGPRDTLLIAMAVLPAGDGRIEWQPIDLDTIPTGHVLSLAQVVAEGYQRLRTYRQAGSPLDHRLTNRINWYPVVRRQGRYWTPNKEVLTEYFLVQAQATRPVAPADYVTLNLHSPRIAQDAPWQQLQARGILGDAQASDPYRKAVGYVLERSYNGVYLFWSRAPLTSMHTTERYYGSGMVEYKPGIGLVSGRYNFYQIVPANFHAYFTRLLVDGTRQLR